MVTEADRFALVFREHYDRIQAYARRRLPPEAAADVTAETFTTAWRRFGDCPERPLPWLYAIARRVLANQVRGQERHRRLEDRVRLAARDGVPVAATDPADTVAGRDHVRLALAQLSPRDQDLLVLVGWDGLELADVAQVVGAPRGVIAVRLHRARRRLERALASTGDADPTADPTPDLTAHPTAVRPASGRTAPSRRSQEI